MICLFVDLFLVWSMWPIINGPERHLRLRVLGGVATLAPISLAILMLADQYGENRWSHLRVTEQILMRKPPAPELLAQVRMKAKEGEEDAAVRALYLDPTLAEPVNFSGRKLRHADLSRSRLPGAVLEGADLSYATLVGADIERAHLFGATLTSASVPLINLKGATVCNADGACQAQLQGADLFGAQLQGADLSEAQLQGANLLAAQLQGADLIDEQLQGAGLRLAQLQGANLRGAQLQGNNLIRVQLQGADLRGASIWGTTINEQTNFILSDLRGVGNSPPDAELQTEIGEKLEAIDDAAVRARVGKRLANVLATPPTDWNAWRVDQEHSRNVLMDEVEDSTASIAGMFGGQANSVNQYQPMIARYLAGLGCAELDVLKGIIKFRIDTFSRTSAPYELMLLNEVLKSSCVPGMKLPEGDRADFQEDVEAARAKGRTVDLPPEEPASPTTP